MSIDHCKPIVIIFCGYLAGWVGTECPHFIIKRGRMIYKFCLIQILVEEFHHLIPHFYPHANIHSPHFRLNLMFPTDPPKPFCTFSTDGTDNFLAIKSFPIFGNNSHSPTIFYQQILHHLLKSNLNALRQKVFLQTAVNLISLLGSQMPNRTFHQL